MGLNRLLHNIADRLGAADLHEIIDQEIDADVEKKDAEKAPETDAPVTADDEAKTENAGEEATDA
jgi:hypothetical protein